MRYCSKRCGYETSSNACWGGQRINSAVDIVWLQDGLRVAENSLL